MMEEKRCVVKRIDFLTSKSKTKIRGNIRLEISKVELSIQIQKNELLEKNVDVDVWIMDWTRGKVGNSYSKRSDES